MFYYKMTDANGVVSYCTSTTEDGVPSEAAPFDDASAFQADMTAHAAAITATMSAAAVVPASISRRQFYQQLAVQGTITNAEALAAVQSGTLPSELQKLVDALPLSAQFSAEMKLAGATEFLRGDALTGAIGQAMGWTSAQIDGVWIAGAQL